MESSSPRRPRRRALVVGVVLLLAAQVAAFVGLRLRSGRNPAAPTASRAVASRTAPVEAESGTPAASEPPAAPLAETVAVAAPTVVPSPRSDRGSGWERHAVHPPIQALRPAWTPPPPPTTASSPAPPPPAASVAPPTMQASATPSALPPPLSAVAPPEPPLAPKPASPAPPPPRPTPRVSGGGSASVGRALIGGRCAGCHAVSGPTHSRAQWQRFFAAGQHDRYEPLGDRVSGGEMASILAFLRENAADGDRDQGAGIR